MIRAVLLAILIGACSTDGAVPDDGGFYVAPDGPTGCFRDPVTQISTCDVSGCARLSESECMANPACHVQAYRGSDSGTACYSIAPLEPIAPTTCAGLSALDCARAHACATHSFTYIDETYYTGCGKAGVAPLARHTDIDVTMSPSL
jgi:hypothetical protein